MTSFATLVTTEGATIFHPERGVYTCTSDHPAWPEILDHITYENYDAAIDLIDRSDTMRRVMSELGDDISISINPISGVCTISGRYMSDEVHSKVQTMVTAGQPIAPLTLFLEKLAENPSKTAWDETLLFMDANDFQITEDGDILGYKGVRENFTDMRTGTFDNRPGSIVSMPRHAVDDDRRVSCSHGLHVAAFGYARNFGPQLLAVSVDPRDVVSIPYDYNNQKMRTCRYTVLAGLGDREEPLVARGGVHRVSDIVF